MAWFCVQIERQNKTVKTSISKENSIFRCWNWTQMWPKFWLFVKKKKIKQQNRMKFFPRMGLGGGESRRGKKFPFGILRFFSDILKCKWQLRYSHFDEDPEWKNPNSSHSPQKKKKMPPLKSLAYILSFCMKILPRFSVYVNYIVDPDTFEELL